MRRGVRSSRTMVSRAGSVGVAAWEFGHAQSALRCSALRPAVFLPIWEPGAVQGPGASVHGSLDEWTTGVTLGSGGAVLGSCPMGSERQLGPWAFDRTTATRRMFLSIWEPGAI